MAPDLLPRLGVAELLHDLRTPLSTIELSAALLGRRALPPELGDVVRRLQTAAHDVLVLAERALELSHPSPSSPDSRRVELMTICERVIEQARVIHPARAITLTGQRPAVGRWDPMAMRELVQNLIMNALEHSRGPVEVSVHLEQGAVVLWVTTAGPAIPEPVRAALFEPFVSGGSGHGLGLSIARRAAEDNGGTLGLRREPGDRNRFEVVLRSG